MKIAHLILAHTYPAMLDRLVTRLAHPESDIYIQLDKKSDYAQFKYIGDKPGVYFVDTRIKTEWGDYSIIEATLTGLKHILKNDTAYSHINLLSGQDYPLRPLQQFHDFLAANPNTTFMKWCPVWGDEWQDGKDRLVKYSLGDYNLPGKYLLQNVANRLLPQRRMPGNLVPYGRSQWLTITPGCAGYVINYIKRNPRVKRFFKMTWAADEVVFQTILVNSALNNKLVNDNLRYIEQFGAKRPNIFTHFDAPKLLASQAFFARKFDDGVDTLIYDILDREIEHTDRKQG